MNSVIPCISDEIMYHKMAKKTWNSLEHTYSQQKNSNLIFQTYYKMMNPKRRDKTLSQYNSLLKALIEKYNACQFVYTSETQKAHRREAGVLLFLAKVNPTYVIAHD